MKNAIIFNFFLFKPVVIYTGVGFCAVLVAFYVSFYYNVIIGWSLYFLAMSSSGELPWVHCNNTWNTASCVEQKDDDWSSAVNDQSDNYYTPRMYPNGSLLVMLDSTSATSINYYNNQSSPAAEYFQ